jgi:hypothetical protein
LNRKRYGHSKQASIRDAKELNDRYSSQGKLPTVSWNLPGTNAFRDTGVTAYSLHPGIVKSNLQGHDPTVLGAIVRFAVKFGPGDTPLHAALNSLFCATSPKAPARGQGKYFTPVGKLSPRADKWINDTEGNARLWQLGEEQLKRLG